MFTGLIKELGKIVSVDKDVQSEAVRLTIHTKLERSEMNIGDSIACNGICLTVTKSGKTQNQNLPNFFEVFLSSETVNRTTALAWKVEQFLNLEPSLKAQSKLAGHYVSGHIDEVAYIKKIRKINQAKEVTLVISKNIQPFIAAKGSVALDGISFTVNQVAQGEFNIMVIPHTSEVTNWSKITQKQIVNLEVDMIARYLVSYAQIYNDNLNTKNK